MRIRATVQLRNDRLIAAREAKAWTQIEAAAQCGVAVSLFSSLERLQFPKTYRYEDALLIAQTMDIERVEDILPERMVGWDGKRKFQYVQEVPIENLLEYEDRQTKHYLLPSPEEEYEHSEELDRMTVMIDECPALTHRQRQFLKLHYGIGEKVKHPHSIKVIAERFGVSKSNVSSRIDVAVRKLQTWAGKKVFMERISVKAEKAFKKNWRF